MPGLLHYPPWAALVAKRRVRATARFFQAPLPGVKIYRPRRDGLSPRPPPLAHSVAYLVLIRVTTIRYSLSVAYLVSSRVTTVRNSLTMFQKL